MPRSRDRLPCYRVDDYSETAFVGGVERVGGCCAGGEMVFVCGGGVEGDLSY